MASTPSFNSSAFCDRAAFLSACPNFTASLWDVRTRNLDGCTSLRGFRSAKQVAPPVSTKACLDRVGAVDKDGVDRGIIVKGPTGFSGCAFGGAGCAGGRGDETTSTEFTPLGRKATVGGDSEGDGETLGREGCRRTVDGVSNGTAEGDG